MLTKAPLVNAVHAYDDKLLLTFNFKDGRRTITFNDVKAATSKSGSDLDCRVVPIKAIVNVSFTMAFIILAECGSGSI